MPIPFHDDETIEELGLAVFLHLETQGETLFGALLFLNARGEPLEFVFNRLELLSDALWRPSDRVPAAQRRLATTLFSAATLSPSFLLVQVAQISRRMFGDEGQIALEIPVARIATELLEAAPHEALTQIETPNIEGEFVSAHVLWTPNLPVGAPARLFALLAERGLLLEPFERARAGLREVYGEALNQDTP